MLSRIGSGRGPKLAAVAATLALAVVGAGCGSDDGDSGGGGGGGGGEDFVIGWLNPLTGTTAQFGIDQQRATQLALEDINKEGIDGKKVEAIYEDNQLEPQASVTAIQKLISEDGVPSVMTSGSSVLLALAPIAQQQKVIVTNTSAQSAAIGEQGGQWVFSFLPDSNAEMEKLAAAATDCLGAKTAAVLKVDNDFGKDTGEAFVEAFEGAGGEIVANETYPLGATDYTNELRKIAGTKPDVLIPVSNGGELGNIAKQNQELGYDFQLIGGTFALSAGNYAIAGDAMNGMHLQALSFDPETPKAKAFAERFQKRFDAPPSTFAAIAYDTAHILADGYREVGTDTEALSEYLTNLRDYEGIMGSYSMTLGDNNTAELPIRPLTVEDGGETLAPWDCKA